MVGVVPMVGGQEGTAREDTFMRPYHNVVGREIKPHTQDRLLIPFIPLGLSLLSCARSGHPFSGVGYPSFIPLNREITKHLLKRSTSCPFLPEKTAGRILALKARSLSLRLTPYPLVILSISNDALLYT